MAIFDQLMNENSEDKGGLASLSEWVFIPEAAIWSASLRMGPIALKIGQFSPELVEIGLRIPYYFQDPDQLRRQPLIRSPITASIP